MYKKIVFLALSLVAYVHPFDFISVECITSPNLQDHRQLYIQHWSSEYVSIPLNQLGERDVIGYLQSQFDVEQKLYDTNEGDRIFVQATQAGKLVGYLSCDIEIGDSIHIRQFALGGNCQQEVFQEMIMYIVNVIPCVFKISISLKKSAMYTMKIIKEAGFKELQNSLSKKDCLYSQIFCMDFASRHMTAWLDVDDEEGNPVVNAIGMPYVDKEFEDDFFETGILSLSDKLCDYPEVDGEYED